ncbi:hypothetical protein [Prosthecobacter sp.]|jgi:hypothetical protein|uniref:hypothetical protein n=1 Tax=Prosthecobacter sp. TaxID=1965333 RepID=UPI003782D3C9
MIVILLALGMWAVPSAWAAEPKPKIQVGPISKGRTLPETRRINGVFAPSKPTIEFSVTLTESMPMKNIMGMIYFFDANNNLVHQTGETPEMDRTKIDEESAKKLERMKRENPKATSFVVVVEGPTTAKAGKKYYYRHVIQEQDPKWTHVVVVVGGSSGDCTARVFPKFDPKLLNFPGKAKITRWFES